MLLSWNFNQYEAFQSFSMAAQLDPTASMAPWGIAYSLGPGANRYWPHRTKFLNIEYKMLA